MPTNTMLSDKAFLDAIRRGHAFSQDEITSFMDTHDIIDAQYDKSGDDKNLVRVYCIDGANIAISVGESDASQDTLAWSQPYEVKKVPMKRIIKLHRWLPDASNPLTTMVGDDVESPLATDSLTAVIKRTRRILAEDGIRPADIRIANLQHRYENGDDGTRFSPKRMGIGSSAASIAGTPRIQPQTHGDRAPAFGHGQLVQDSAPNAWGLGLDRSADGAELGFSPKRMGIGRRGLRIGT